MFTVDMFEPAERPADRTAVRWVFDALVPVAAAVTAMPFLDGGDPRMRTLGTWILVLVVAPLAVRRIWPIPVLAWVLLSSVAAGLWNANLMAGAAVAIMLYTVAAMRPRRDALVTAALAECAVIGASVRIAGGRWWFVAIFLTGMAAAALGLGLYSATRRAYLAGLRDRAAHLERERDQQGALAAAAERARIAREMHDIVAHHLTVMVTLSDGAIAASANSPQRAAEVMRSVSATGRQALADTRRLLGVLRQPGSEEESQDLAPIPDLGELDALIARIQAAGLATTFEVHGAVPDVPAGVQLTVYRLVQEALTNTLKHAGPSARAAVRLRYTPHELRVEVDDDGTGRPGPLGNGAGLAGMRERVHAYGGDVSAGPRGTGGWRVSARLSLDGTEAM